jgi:hypothetical protein
MRIKTFEAVNMKEALKAVKNEFGNEAVILKTRQKDLDGTGQAVELTVATPSEVVPNNIDTLSGIDKDKSLVQYLGNLEKKINYLTDESVRQDQFFDLVNSVDELRVLLLEQVQNKGQLKDVPVADLFPLLAVEDVRFCNVCISGLLQNGLNAVLNILHMDQIVFHFGLEIGGHTKC